MILLAAAWLALVVPLAVAAIGRHRQSTKIGALIGLAIVFALSWGAILMVLGDLAAHTDTGSWPSPITLAAGFMLAYLLVAFAAFRRKLR